MNVFVFTILLISCFVPVFVQCQNNGTTAKSICDDDSIECRTQEISDYLYQLDENPSIPIIGDYVVLEKKQEVNGNMPRSTENLIENCMKFLSSRSLKISYPNSDSRAFFAGRKNKKIKKYILPLLLFLKLKAAILLPILLTIIALVSFKGFGLSLAALAIAGTSALKNLVYHAGPKVSYEVVPPIAHWSRGDNNNNNLY